MSLPGLSCDNLAHITRYLTPDVIYSLIFCGSRNLNSKLLAETSILEFQLGFRSPFPFSAYQFRRLRHLSVSMKEDLKHIPLSLNGASMLPREPVKSLVKLVLFVPQSFAVLSSDGANSRLSDCFPNLEVLRLSGSITSILERVHLERLPRTLRDLTLAYHSITRKLIPVEWIESLPTNLERLSLPSFNLTEESHDDEMTSTISWPPGLTKLRIGRLPSLRHFRTLPKRLIKFVGASMSAESPEDILMSSLPSSLTHLGINQSYTPTFVLDVPLNPCMKLCRVPSMMVPGGQRPTATFSDSWHVPLEVLPKTLKSMSGLQILASPDNIAQLPRALERLLLGRAFRGFSNYAALPRLTFLSIADEVSASVDVPYEDLSPTLTHLMSSFTRESQLKKLPGSLLELRISSRRENTIPFLGPNALAKLPRSITALSITLTSFTSRESLLGMPAIKKFTLIPRPCNTPLGVDPLLMQLLPTSIEYLKLSPFEKLAPLNVWVRDLHRFDKLHSLWLRPHSHPPDPTLFNHEVLVGLPTTLTKLHILTGPNWATNLDLFDHLPPGLLDLRVCPMYYQTEPKPFETQHLTKLPHSLTNLSVEPTTLISGEFFRTAPPHLASLHLDATAPDFAEAKRAYYQQPQWEGCPPVALPEPGVVGGGGN